MLSQRWINLLAKLQFKNYHIANIEYKFNYLHSEENNEETFKLGLDYKIEPINDDYSEAWVHLIFTTGDKELKNNSLYINVEIVGLFEINTENQSVNDNIDFLTINANAILFPYLRSLVSEVTSKGNESPIILPTINVVSFIKEQRKKEEGF